MIARSDIKAWDRLVPRSKGRELLGLLLLCVGLLLLLSLISHNTRDPSLFYQATEPEARRNLVGPVGSEISALAFGLFGLPVLLAPVLLIAAAWSRLRSREHESVVGRGLGAVLFLMSLPPLFFLVFERLPWWGGDLQAGGAIGVFVGGLLRDRLGLVGGMLVICSVMLVGVTLLVQSSLEELLTSFWDRLRDRLQALRLVHARRRERRAKEKAREQVLRKYVERNREMAHDDPDDDFDESLDHEDGLDSLVLDGTGSSSGVTRTAGPVRVKERSGDRGFGVRRVVARQTPDVVASDVVSAAPEEEPRAPAPKKRRAKRSKTSPSKPRSKGQLKLSDPPKPGTLPPANLLNLEQDQMSLSEDALIQLGEVIKNRCAEFGVEGEIEGISPGPVLTLFEFKPAPGVKVSQIVNLQDELALSLKAEAIRIDRMPGRSTLGIEVPNEKRSIIRLGPLFSESTFSAPGGSPLLMALGTNLQGEPYFCDLKAMPHLLVAGATGAGKSVGLQSMITSILYRSTRDDVQFIFIDPKRIELGVYSEIPHLKTEVVVEPKKAANALRWAVAEMERRYRLLAEVHVRSIDFYNQAIGDPEVRKRLALRDEDESSELESLDNLKPLPYYVIIIDELADLMMVSSSEVETSIARLAQMARAVGIHLIVATQRPSVDVLTGTIKANFPCRIAFATATRHDSRTILDQIGAEKLLGKGDMLFLPPGSSRPVRLHGSYVSEQETAALVRWLKKQGPPELDPEVLEAPQETKSSGASSDDQDELFDQAARLVVSEGMGSASFLQRRMRVGFSRAARLIDLLEADGILGPAQGSKPREVLVKKDFFEEIDQHE